MTAKPITTRACNEQPCLSLTGSIILSGVNSGKVGPMTLWIAYATNDTYDNYVVASSAKTTVATDDYKGFNIDELLSADVPAEHRKRIFTVFKTSENAEIGMFSFTVATGIGGASVVTRNVAIYGGFTGVCSNLSEDAIYVNSFAHNSILYTGVSSAPSFAPAYGHLGPNNSRGWTGRYYPSVGASMVLFREGIAYSGPPAQGTVVTAYGIDLYGVGF